MFTGIVEAIGKVSQVVRDGSNRSFWIESNLASQLKIDQSLNHDGVCLTVEDINGNSHRVTAVAETLKKTNLAGWETGREINLERALKLGDRLDGHLVQGHVDCKAICKKITRKNGSTEICFKFSSEFNTLIIEKGSISVNGVSLTAFDVRKKRFTVTVIPYTYDHTNLKNLVVDQEVNIEFDMIGKYLTKQTSDS